MHVIYGGIVMDECETHADHTHQHGPNCGHKAVGHNGHVDYLHDGHLHHVHGDHVDEHVLEVNATNPDACTADQDCAAHDKGHFMVRIAAMNGCRTATMPTTW